MGVKRKLTSAGTGRKDMKRKMIRVWSFPLSKKMLLQKKIGLSNQKGLKAKKVARTERKTTQLLQKNEDKIFIHEDIMQEIFLRLPVKPLQRCKSLSKISHCSISSAPFLERYRRSRRTSMSSVMLGLFRQDSAPGVVRPIPIQFIPVTHQGEKMMKEDEQKKLGMPPFDGSLSFLLNAKAKWTRLSVMASSNGFLLLRKEREGTLDIDYYVCNPISKQWAALPRPPPKTMFETVVETFICHGCNYPCFEWVTYTVVRGVIDYSSPACSLDVDIFSSKTGEWIELQLSGTVFISSITSMLVEPVISEKETVCSFIIDASSGEKCFLVFNANQNKKHFQIVKSPRPGVITDMSWGCLGLSQGSIQYMIYNWCNKFEVWELSEDCYYNKTKWYLRYVVSMSTFPGYYYNDRNFHFLAIHPTQSTVALVYLDGSIMLMYLLTNSLIFICKFDETDLRRHRWFPYQWPCWPPLID